MLRKVPFYFWMALAAVALMTMAFHVASGWAQANGGHDAVMDIEHTSVTLNLETLMGIITVVVAGAIAWAAVKHHTKDLSIHTPRDEIVTNEECAAYRHDMRSSLRKDIRLAILEALMAVREQGLPRAYKEANNLGDYDE